MQQAAQPGRHSMASGTLAAVQGVGAAAARDKQVGEGEGLGHGHDCARFKPVPGAIARCFT